MESEKEIPRRNFLSRALIIWITMVILPMLYALVRYVIPPAVLETIVQKLVIARVSDIPPGGAKLIKLNRTPIMVVRSTDGQIRAFSAICTHLGCVVQYNEDQKIFHCNCHGSEFDLSGKNIGGPAPRPLQPYRTEVKDDQIMVSQV